MADLRISTIEEAPLQASKWLKTQVLLDGDEMQHLCESLGEFHFYLCGSICHFGEGELSQADFLKHYGNYVAALERGELPDQTNYRKWFSAVMTKSSEALYAIPMGEGKQLLRVARPIVQLQAHHMGYSPVDGRFRPMVFGSDSIPWGIQFAYPQLFQDNATKQVEQTRHAPEFPNTELFQALQKWLRAHTIPTPFVVNAQTINVPMRLGKACLPWINKHPQLVSKNIQVLTG